MTTEQFKRVLRLQFIKSNAFALKIAKIADIKRNASSLTKEDAEIIKKEVEKIQVLFQDYLSSKDLSIKQEEALKKLLFCNYIKQHVLLYDEKNLIEQLKQNFHRNEAALKASKLKINAAYTEFKTALKQL